MKNYLYSYSCINLCNFILFFFKWWTH